MDVIWQYTGFLVYRGRVHVRISGPICLLRARGSRLERTGYIHPNLSSNPEGDQQSRRVVAFRLSLLLPRPSGQAIPRRRGAGRGAPMPRSFASGLPFFPLIRGCAACQRSATWPARWPEISGSENEHSSPGKVSCVLPCRTRDLFVACHLGRALRDFAQPACIDLGVGPRCWFALCLGRVPACNTRPLIKGGTKNIEAVTVGTSTIRRDDGPWRPLRCVADRPSPRWESESLWQTDFPPNGRQTLPMGECGTVPHPDGKVRVSEGAASALGGPRYRWIRSYGAGSVRSVRDSSPEAGPLRIVRS